MRRNASPQTANMDGLALRSSGRAKAPCLGPCGSTDIFLLMQLHWVPRLASQPIKAFNNPQIKRPSPSCSGAAAGDLPLARLFPRDATLIARAREQLKTLTPLSTQNSA